PNIAMKGKSGVQIYETGGDARPEGRAYIGGCRKTVGPTFQVGHWCHNFASCASISVLTGDCCSATTCVAMFEARVLSAFFARSRLLDSTSRNAATYWFTSDCRAVAASFGFTNAASC